MCRFDSVQKCSRESLPETATKAMEKLVSEIVKTKEVLMFSNYTDVKLFYRVAKSQGFKSHARKSYDSSGWACWVDEPC